MMKFMAMVGLASVLAGCATPADLRSTATPITRTSSKAPAELANCIGRIGTEMGVIPTVFPGSRTGTFEITLRAATSWGTDVYVLVEPDGKWSKATYYFGPFIASKGAADEFYRLC